MSPLITLRRRVPLLPRLLLWLMLNLAIVGALIVLQPGSQGLGWNSLLSNPVRERLLDLAQRIAADLATAPATGRQAVLDRATARYGMSFLVQEDGPSPPPESAPSSDRGPFAPDRPPGFTAPPPQGHPPGPPPDQLRTDTDADGAAHARREPPRGPLPGRGPERNASMLAAAITIEHPYPFDHWRVRIPAALAATSEPTGPPPRPIMLTAETTHFWALLGFLGVARGSGLLLAAIGISLALWWLFAWDITRTVSAINHATQRIAEGRFDVRIATRRRDELGDLADAVNRMAVKLDRQYADQRAFVADVAHEITSPLARLQMGLGVLETRLAPEIRSALDDVRDDVEQMAAMLDELLMFSRAGLAAGRPAEAVAVRPIALAALAQENAADAVRLTIDDHWIVRAHAPLLQRALANLIRNALRYAGDETGSIELVAEAAGNQAMALIVQDRGSGVSAKVLPRLGEPFYRPDAARTRDTGGHGLGLAIVRRCIEACDGEVSFANREGGGFEARLLLATVR